MCVACSKTSQSLGKIRLTVRLTEERILPSEYYEPLIEILNDSVSLEKVSESSSGLTTLHVHVRLTNMALC